MLMDNETDRHEGTSSTSDAREPNPSAADRNSAGNGTSERKIAANRRNARRSTGPRTAEGKLRPRRNALRHGLSANEIIVPGFEDPSEYERMHYDLRADLVPVGAAEELIISQIAACFLRLHRIARIEAAQAFLSQRQAILAPYVGAPSSSELAHERLRKREEDIAQLETELAYVARLIASWDEAMRFNDETWNRLAGFSIAELFVDLDPADGQQQLDKLLHGENQLRVVLAALEGAEAPVSIRAHAVLSPADPSRYQFETNRRLNQLFQQLHAMQDRRLARQAAHKRPPQSATVIDVTAAEESA
jgi:hypothetical protein